MKRNYIGSFLIFMQSNFRKITNPVINWIAIKNIDPVPDLDFQNYVESNPLVFRNEIMRMIYISDPIGGLIDFTFKNPKYFFHEELPFGRDCDDYAYMWYLYWNMNDQKSWIYSIMPDWNIKRAHAICITKVSDGLYRIYDYASVYSGKTIKEALNIYFKIRYEKDFYKKLSYAIMKKPKDKEILNKLIK